MNKKYIANQSAQIIIGIILTLLLLLGIAFWFRLLENSLWYLVLLPAVFSLVQFSLTPLLRGLGIFHYYSDFLMANTSDSSSLDLHTGTTFDYFLHIGLRLKGIRARNYIASEIIDGLLVIILHIEQGEIKSSKKIVASPYFASLRTIKKFGFKTKAPCLLDKIFIIGSFVDIMMMYSFTKNRITIPDVFKLKQVEMEAGDLVTKKDYLLKMKKKFSPRNF